MSAPVHFHLNDRPAADRLVKQHHYSHRIPANVQLCGTWRLSGGLFGETGDAVAAVFFSLPPTRWTEVVWELSRLVRCENVDIPPLTGLIATASAWCRRKGADLLVSFADRTAGHHGGVYQAASWAYGGLRDRNMDGVLVGGQFVPGRSANSIWGTRSPARLLERHGIQAEPHYDEGKHLYWRALNAKGQAKAERLGLARLPYPKPQMFTEVAS